MTVMILRLVVGMLRGGVEVGLVEALASKVAILLARPLVSRLRIR